MSTPLLSDFPELSNLSRDDLQELLLDPVYFQAVFHSLTQVKALYQAQAELGSANENIAKSNLALQDSLYKLRSETQEAFDDAKSLDARWKELEKEQREVYQVCRPAYASWPLLIILRQTAIHTTVPPHALETCNDRSGRSLRSPRLRICASIICRTFSDWCQQ